MDLSCRRTCGQSHWFPRTAEPSYRPGSVDCSTSRRRLPQVNTGMKPAFDWSTSFTYPQKSVGREADVEVVLAAGEEEADAGKWTRRTHKTPLLPARQLP